MSADAPRTRQVSIADACRILGLSRSTVERRLARGELSGRKIGARWVVDLPGEPATSGDTAPDARVAELTQQVKALTQRCADLEQHLTKAEAEREDWKQQARAESTNVQAALAVRALLAERAESHPETRPRWQFWRR